MASGGRSRAARLKPALDAIERRYGVPAGIVLAIWGRESGFGAARIPHNAFEVLGTKAFLATRKETRNGLSLKDFDLKTRLFKNRCSYMIYSNVFQGLPDLFKQGVYLRLGQALDTKTPNPAYSYLSAIEKQTLHGILKETLPGLPATW